MAEEGIVFEHAFSNSPVCSVERTTLATGVYAPRIAAQYHRKIRPVRLSEGWRLFPAYLRDAGYHTTNNAKKDYNVVEGPGVWDASSRDASWRDRPSEDTPFFHMRSFGASHESSLHLSERELEEASPGTDPAAVELAPYHPDTRVFRTTYARYHDRMRRVDRYRMVAYREWRSLYRKSELDPVERQFFEPKPAEALYDLEANPHETRNLAGRADHAGITERMRERLRQCVKGLPDLSFFPESVLVERALGEPVAFGRAQAARIGRLVDVADLALRPFARARPGIEAALASEDPWERYWALIASSAHGEAARPLAGTARELLDDEEPLVRVRAAELLGTVGAEDPRPAILDVLRTAESPVVALITLQTVVYLRDGPPGVDFDITAEDVRAESGLVRRRLRYLSGDG